MSAIKSTKLSVRWELTYDFIDADRLGVFADRVASRTRLVGPCLEWTGSRDRYGYGILRVCCRGIRKQVKAHRLSYSLFVGDIPAGLCVCHHCDNPACIRPTHLFLGTNGDNSDDKVRKGREAKGAADGNSKLTEEQVRSIRAEYVRYVVTRKELARRYGVSESLVKQIVGRKIWRHVGSPPPREPGS